MICHVSVQSFLEDDMNKDIYESINNEILNLHYRWKVFRNVYAKNEEQIILINKIDSEFFGIVQEVYQDSIVLYLSRLTDKEKMGWNNRNLSLYTFINDIEKDIDNLTKSKMVEKLKKIEVLVKKIRTQRSKMIAHLDYDCALNVQKAKTLGISRKDIELVLEAIRDFMNIANGYIYNSETTYDGIMNINGGEALFDFLDKNFK